MSRIRERERRTSRAGGGWVGRQRRLERACAPRAACMLDGRDPTAQCSQRGCRAAWRSAGKRLGDGLGGRAPQGPRSSPHLLANAREHSRKPRSLQRSQEEPMLRLCVGLARCRLLAPIQAMRDAQGARANSWPAMPAAASAFASPSLRPHPLDLLRNSYHHHGDREASGGAAAAAWRAWGEPGGRGAPGAAAVLGARSMRRRLLGGAARNADGRRAMDRAQVGSQHSRGVSAARAAPRPVSGRCRHAHKRAGQPAAAPRRPPPPLPPPACPPPPARPSAEQERAEPAAPGGHLSCAPRRHPHAVRQSGGLHRAVWRRALGRGWIAGRCCRSCGQRGRAPPLLPRRCSSGRLLACW